MIEEKLNAGSIYRITLFGKFELPSWTLIHYCHQTLINSLKMTSILKMIELTRVGKRSEDFAIEAKPKELYPIFEDELLSKSKKAILMHYEYEFERKIIYLLEKEESPNQFWNLVKNQDRPNILVRDGSSWVPLYDQEYRTATVLKSVSVNSPPQVSFEGLGETINDLRFGKEREIRTHIEWQNEQIGNSADNMSRLLKSAALLNDPNVPAGLKAYAAEMYANLLQKQAELNEKIALDRAEIKCLN